MSRRQPSAVGPLLADYRNFAGSRLWVALGLMLGGAVAEGVGILMIVPLATLAIGEVAMSGPLSRFSSIATGVAPQQRFTIVLIVFVAAMALRSLLMFARDRQLSLLSAGYEASLRLRAASTLAGRGWTFASRIGQAGMQSLLLNDVPRVEIAIAQAQTFAIGAVVLTVQFCLAALLSPALSLLALAIVGLASLMAIGWVRRGLRSGMALVESGESSTGSGFRLHAGLKAALAQGTVPQFLGEYRTTLERNQDEIARYQQDMAAASGLAFTASAIAAAMLMFAGYRLLHLPFPILVTSLILFARMAAPAQQLQRSAQFVAAYAPSYAAIVDRLQGLDPSRGFDVQAEPLEWTTLQVESAGFLHCEGLGLRDATFDLAPGQWLGIGGASGGGKTTLLDMVAGLLAPQHGTVSVDGEPLTGHRLDRWRAGLAYVGQEGSVFDDTVRGNLLAEGALADDNALWSALRLVGLEPRIGALPGGLDQRIGDRGSQLSGGERQRLSIARALLRRPSLLILDEATSALDPDGEAAIIDALRALDPRPAALIVAHRQSTLDHCDLRLRIKEGVLRS